jgi:hypothetical protein
MDDSGARAAPRGPPRGGPRVSESPPRRRRCSSARSGSAHPGGARGPHDTPQRAEGGVAPATGAWRLIRRTRSRSSRSTSACPRPTRSGRATTTRSTPRPPGRARCLKLSRRSLRARFLWTDPPTRRLTARPRRSKARPLGAATTRNRRPSRRAPRLNAASNSAPVRRRSRERNRMRLPAPARHLRRRSASGPSGGGASGRAALPSSACGRGSRGCASGGGCSAGTSSSSVNPMGRGDETRRPAGQTLKATGAGGRLSNGRHSARRAALYTPGSCGTFPRSRISHNCGLLHGSQSHFSTTVEISVQKGCGVTGRPHPSWALFVTC